MPGFCTILLDVIVRQNDNNTISKTWQYATPVVTPTKQAEESYRTSLAIIPTTITESVVKYQHTVAKQKL